MFFNVVADGLAGIGRGPANGLAGAHGTVADGAETLADQVNRAGEGASGGFRDGGKDFLDGFDDRDPVLLLPEIGEGNGREAEWEWTRPWPPVIEKFIWLSVMMSFSMTTFLAGFSSWGSFFVGLCLVLAGERFDQDVEIVVEQAFFIGERRARRW